MNFLFAFLTVTIFFQSSYLHANSQVNDKKTEAKIVIDSLPLNTNYDSLFREIDAKLADMNSGAAAGKKVDPDKAKGLAELRSSYEREKGVCEGKKTNIQVQLFKSFTKLICILAEQLRQQCKTDGTGYMCVNSVHEGLLEYHGYVEKYFSQSFSNEDLKFSTEIAETKEKISLGEILSEPSVVKALENSDYLEVLLKVRTEVNNIRKSAIHATKSRDTNKPRTGIK